VAGGNGGNKLGAAGRRFTCTLGLDPAVLPEREVAGVDAVGARDVIEAVAVVAVDSVTIERIRALDWDGRGGREAGRREGGGGE
jgi:hypothetical protein